MHFRTIYLKLCEIVPAELRLEPNIMYLPVNQTAQPKKYLVRLKPEA